MICVALIYLIYLINIPKPFPQNFWFQQFHLTHFMHPFLPADFDWFLQMKCQRVMDQTNFPMFLLLPGKLGRNSPDKRNVFCAQGWGNTSKCSDSFARQKANTDVAFSVRSISFRQGICQLSRYTLSVCACRVRFIVSTIMSQKSVVFCEVHSNEPFPTVLKFFRFSPRKWNAPCIALNASHLKWWILQVL